MFQLSGRYSTFNMKTPKRLAAKSKMMAKKKILSKRIVKKGKGSALKSKPLMPSLLINGKRVPARAMKMSSGPKSKDVSMFSTLKEIQTLQEKLPPQGEKPLLQEEKFLFCL